MIMGKIKLNNIILAKLMRIISFKVLEECKFKILNQQKESLKITNLMDSEGLYMMIKMKFIMKEIL